MSGARTTSSALVSDASRSLGTMPMDGCHVSTSTSTDMHKEGYLWHASSAKPRRRAV